MSRADFNVFPVITVRFDEAQRIFSDPQTEVALAGLKPVAVRAL